MNECLFCKIVNKEIPNYTVYENDHILAFLDIFPCTKGHVVVIPKVHAETLFDLSSSQKATLFDGVQEVMKKVERVLSPEGFNVGLNHLEAGGQTVPHLHIHILPRWKGDGGGSMHSVVKNVFGVKVEDVAKLFL